MQATVRPPSFGRLAHQSTKQRASPFSRSPLALRWWNVQRRNKLETIYRSTRNKRLNAPRRTEHVFGLHQCSLGTSTVRLHCRCGASSGRQAINATVTATTIELARLEDTRSRASWRRLKTSHADTASNGFLVSKALRKGVI